MLLQPFQVDVVYFALGAKLHETRSHLQKLPKGNMGILVQDLRFGLRMLRSKPTFTFVAVLTLALGVGANTAIFSIVDAVLLRPLPFRNPDRLVKISFDDPALGLRDLRFSVPELDDLRFRSGVFDEVTPAFAASVNLTGAKQPERLELMVTLPNYFSMLGAKPQIGRLFGPQDFALGFAPAIVISDSLWHRAYGGDPDVLGRDVRLDNDLYTIVGVLPPGFRHPGPTVARDVEVWATAGFSADPAPKPARSTRIMPTAIGSLKPGLTLKQAQMRLDAMAIELRHEFPTDYARESEWTIRIQPLQESLVGNVRPMLLVLMGAVVMIVSVVSLNLANLLLARASGRQQEISVRLAIGASRARVIRQMLTESTLLSFIGGAFGIAMAMGTLDLLLKFIPASIPRLSEIGIDWVVLSFALVVSLLTGLLFGLAPALHSTKSDLSLRIREGTRGSSYSARTGRLRDALIVSELAFAVVLMVGAGLLLRTLRELLRQSPGFDPSHVVTANVWLPVPNDPKADPYRSQAQQTTFNRELLRRMNAIPGVQLAGITSGLPTASHNDINAQLVTALTIEDRPVQSSQDLRAEAIRVSPDYFKVMQAGLVSGRFFADSDEDVKQPVVIVDQATARKYWLNGDALGRRLRRGRDPKLPWLTVVGIIADIKHDGLDVNGIPHIYLPMNQSLGRTLSVVLRTNLPATVLEPQIRHEIQTIDPGLPVFNVSSMNEVLDRSLASRRFSADLVGGFAALAVLLASIGIYGLLAYMVGQRSRELGVRMALGANRTQILKLILGKGVILAAIGIIAGMFFSASSAPMLSSLLYGVRPHDFFVFAAVPLLLFVVALAASYIPAWRATKLDPLAALRDC
ncbi:MAG: ABC transporter permease [Acidobacteriaceae bacterium]|nr:ABC transporter permease [Acidobacteriaceae bacterium]